MSAFHIGSSSDSPVVSASRSPRKVNDSVYKFERLHGPPTLQILFFHGLQFEDSLDTHFRNWESRDRSVIWPEKWLVEDFPTAEILYISYDASVKKGSHLNGSPDMYTIAENLMSDLIHAKVGQIMNCPVIMVGHCFGGIVIKELCLRAHKPPTDPTKHEMFLENIKGIFYYSTPHHGSRTFDEFGDKKHPLWSYFRVLSTEVARLNYEFDPLWKSHGWHIDGIGASLPVQSGRFKGLLVVEESSARGGHSFTMREADHFGICKPEGKNSSGYYVLVRLLRRIESSTPKAERLIPGLPAYPTGLERRCQEVQGKLEGAPVVGIIGMGGVGKTTIAKEVYNNIYSNFEYTCFAENVKRMEDEFEDRVLRNCYRRGKRVDRKVQWSDLRKTKALVVLDDVAQKQMNLLPTSDWFGEGSLFIITSRDQGVLNAFVNPVIYQVDFLIEDEAKKLFCRYTFGEDGIPDLVLRENLHVNENVEEVVRKCGGLPLTLEVTGCYLRNQTDPEVWKETIKKLGEAQDIYGLQDDRVWSSLKVSYDGLDSELQSMFIEAGTYFFGCPVHQALAAWSTAYRYSRTAWDNLLRTSMVKEIDNRDSGKWDDGKEIWVHEHLRDLANNLSKGSTVSVSIAPGRTMDLLNAVKSETKHLRIIESRFAERPTTIQLESLDKLEELKYLELHRVAPEGSSTNFPKKLSLLIWKLEDRIPHSLPISLQEMNSLAVLELSGFTIPKGSIDVLGTLTNLRTLSLDNISGLDRLPGTFDHLSQLKRLKLSGLVRMDTLPHSIGHLPVLEDLELGRLFVQDLPESFGNLSALATLRMSDCQRLRSLPENFGDLKALKFLEIQGATRLKALPDSFGYLSALRVFRLAGCDSLKSLPPSLVMLSSLEELRLELLPQLDAVPETFGELKALNRLVIQRAKRLKALPDSFGNLSALTLLHLDDCESLESLPPSFGMLLSLEKLVLRGLEQLDAVPETFGELKALKTLVITGPIGLKALPDSFGKLSALTLLHLDHCESLESLPPSFGMLSSLERLELENLKQLDTLPESFGELKALKRLRISWATCLKALPESFGELEALERLDISFATCLKALPESFGNLSALTYLFLYACKGLESLPVSFGMLSSLEELHLHELEQLDTLPETFEELKALKRLVISTAKRLKDLESLESLPLSFGMLSSLEELELEGLQLDTLPETFGELKALRRLVIKETTYLEARFTFLRRDGCESLESLPPSFGKLSFLEELELSWAERLHTVPETFGNLKALKRLVIKKASSLKALPESFGNLSALTYLHLECCASLKMLPASSGNLSSLDELVLISCEHFLLESLGHLKALKRLKLLECNHLEALPDSLGNLSSLTSLYISGERLRSVPKSIGQLHSLRILRIMGSNLSSIPEELGNLSSLESLWLDCCDRIETLRDGLGRISSLRQVILNCCSALKTIPGSWVEDFAPREDRSIETRRTERGRSSHKASTDRIRLWVRLCPFLNDSVLRRLGWIETCREEFIHGNVDVSGHRLDRFWGNWYRREGPLPGRGCSTKFELS